MRSYEHSCGVIVFRQEEGKRVYLAVCSNGGAVGIPKGHREGQETERETALRELWEETGVRAELLDGFRVQIEYPLPKKGPEVWKTVTFFAGRPLPGPIVRQEKEIAWARYLSFEELMPQIAYPTVADALRQAEEWLNQTENEETVHG